MTKDIIREMIFGFSIVNAISMLILGASFILGVAVSQNIFLGVGCFLCGGVVLFCVALLLFRIRRVK